MAGNTILKLLQKRDSKESQSVYLSPQLANFLGYSKQKKQNISDIFNYIILYIRKNNLNIIGSPFMFQTNKNFKKNLGISQKKISLYEIKKIIYQHISKFPYHIQKRKEASYINSEVQRGLPSSTSVVNPI